MELEKLLKQLGNPGKFQVLIFLLLALNYFPINFNHVIMAFYGTSMPHVCVGESKQLEDNNTSVFNTNKTAFNACFKPSETNSTTEECKPGEWEYTISNRESTLVSEFDLVCNRADLVNIATSIYFCGVMLGGFLFGQVADKFGRKMTIIFTLYAQIAVGLAIAFSPSYVVFVILRFVQGVLMQGLQTSTYVLGMEYFLPKHRTAPGVIFEVYWGVAVMCIAGITYFIRTWKYIQLAISIPSIITLTYIWFIPESLRWLIMRQRLSDVYRLVDRIAKFNKLQSPTALFKKTSSVAELENLKAVKLYTLYDTIKTPQIRKRTLVLFFIWFSSAIGYYGITFSLSGFAGNKYLNFFLGGVVETVAYLLSIYILKRFGRKKPLIVYFIIGGVCCIIAGALPKGKTDSGFDLDTVRTVFAILGKFGMSGLFSVNFLYTTELYPTVIRNIGLGACASFARIGSLTAPQVLTLGRRFNSTSAPIIVFGCLGLFGAVLTLVLPETLNTKLPDTIAEAEHLHLHGKETDSDGIDMNGSLPMMSPTEQNSI